MGTRHVLVGTGPASIAAAETIRGLDPSAAITLLGAEEAGYYSRPGLAYLLAREVPEKALHPLAGGVVDRLRVRALTDPVVAVDAAARSVTTSSGATVPYDRLLLATGSRSLPSGLPGDDLDGVVKLDDLADARSLISRSRHVRTAVVIGGGITALEIVEGLRRRGVAVHYFVRRDRYWGNVLSPAESASVQEGLAASGVEVHYSTEVEAILGRDGHVTGVRTAGGETIACELVAVAIGVAPAIDLALDAGLACGRGVLVDQYLRTSDPDVFAAGDIAEVTTSDGGRRMDVLWNSAVDKGRVAGRNMAGMDPAAYTPGLALNVTRLAGRRITIMGAVGSDGDTDLKGLSRGDSQAWRQGAGDARVVECDRGGMHLRLVLGSRTIEGAVVMGDQALSFPLQEVISSRADATRFVSEALAPGADVMALVERFAADVEAGRV